MQEPRVWLVHMSCRGSLDFSLDKGWMLWWSWLGCLRVTSHGGHGQDNFSKNWNAARCFANLAWAGPRWQPGPWLVYLSEEGTEFSMM